MDQDNQNQKIQTTKIHKLQIKPVVGTEDQFSVGSNTSVWLDGKRLQGVKSVKFDVAAKGVANVLIELVATLEVDVNVDLAHKEVKETDMVVRKQGILKPVLMYELGTAQAADVALKPEESGCASAGSKPYCSSCSCGKKEAFEKKHGG